MVSLYVASGILLLQPKYEIESLMEMVPPPKVMPPPLHKSPNRPETLNRS
jgi:hypothetical protein